MCLDAVDIVVDAGYNKPVTTITMSSKSELMHVLMLHYTLYRNKAVLDQLQSGLSTLGALDAMKKYPRVLEPFFVHSKKPPLTAGMHNINNVYYIYISNIYTLLRVLYCIVHCTTCFDIHILPN